MEVCVFFCFVLIYEIALGVKLAEIRVIWHPFVAYTEPACKIEVLQRDGSEVLLES